MSESLVYLITGANRGLGKGVLDILVQRPNTTVIAGVRDVSSALKTFSSVPLGENSKIITVKIDSTSDKDPYAAVQELEFKHSITKLDVLISNAGILNTEAQKPVAEVTSADLRTHLETNTVAVLTLFNAFYPLLQKSTTVPKFFTISSYLGSIASIKDRPVPFFVYGITKAAVNYMMRKIHYENEGLISVPVHPGWVQTDMGNGAARTVGVEAPLKFEDAVRDLVKFFDGATMEISGTFARSDEGEEIPW
jgi:norsolorinic acid ketoreductase